MPPLMSLFARVMNFKEKIWAEFQVVEGKGGIVPALEEKYPQQQIADILAQRFKKLEFRLWATMASRP